MKILYYNWIQFDNPDNIGGGVNIYQRNLIDYLIENTDYEICFLSAGWEYNPFKSKTYIVKTNNIYEPKCKSYKIINSPIISPAFATYMNPLRFINDNDSYEILKKFITKNGPFDVIHFNNIEGISINALKIKEDFPNTKIIISIHNYQPICPLVQYFQNHNNCICNDFKEGKECLKCTVWLPDKKQYVHRCRNYLMNKIQPRFKAVLKPIINIYTKLLKPFGNKYTGNKKTMLAKYYKEYRTHNISIINKYADVILAVSDRVGEIMIQHGVDPNLVQTSYIGTKFAEKQIRKSIAKTSQFLTICYLGYERHDKGYYFFLESLSKIKPEIKSKINIVLAVANIHEKFAREKLTGFNNVKIYNGYTHEELKSILSDVNLGIIPVLWEDNLPQVAIEMVANGVPILCSSFGGASELCTSKIFKFQGGSEKDFINKLLNIVDNRDLLQEYWKNHDGLKTMTEHILELNKIYKD